MIMPVRAALGFRVETSHLTGLTALARLLAGLDLAPSRCLLSDVTSNTHQLSDLQDSSIVTSEASIRFDTSDTVLVIDLRRLRARLSSAPVRRARSIAKHRVVSIRVVGEKTECLNVTGGWISLGERVSEKPRTPADLDRRL
jgi:hypothetical protein